MYQGFKRSLVVAGLLASFLTACSQDDASQKAVDAPVKEAVIQSVSSVESAVTQSKSATKKIFDLVDVKKTYQGMNFQVSDISQREYEGGNSLAITFTVPLNPAKKFSDFIEVRTSIGTVAGSWVLSDSGKVAYFENIEPDTAYNVIIDWHITSALEDRLGSDEKKTIRTRRVVSSVTFASSGHFLPLDLHSGLPVTTVNVPVVDVNFHHVAADDVPNVLNMLGERQTQRHYRLGQVAKNGKLVHSGRYELPAKANKRQTYNLPLNEITALKKPGLYVAVMQVPGSYDDQIQTSYFMVTDLGVHVRRYKNKIDVYVNSLKTAKAIDNVTIDLVDRSGGVLSRSRTTNGGKVEFNRKYNKARYLLASFQDSYSIIPLKQAALDLSDFDLGTRPYQDQELFIYSERDLYRPGDTVNFNALLRDFDAKQVRTKPLKAKLKKANGQVAKDFSWNSNDNGYYQFSYKLANNAKLGSWSLEVAGVGSKKVIFDFKVEEFLPERLKLTFNNNSKEKLQFSSSDVIKLPVLGEYLYGAPAIGNRFDANIKVALQRHPFDDYKDFYFGDEKEIQWNASFNQERLKTDDQGKVLLEIPSTWQETKSPLKVSVVASLYETGGRPISRKHVVNVVPDGQLIGIRPTFKEYAPANSKAIFEIIKTDAKEKYTAKDLTVELIREDRRYYWEYSRNEGWHYEYTANELVELSTNISIDDSLTTKLALPVEYGKYRIEVSDNETGIKSTYKFKAGEDWYAWWRGAQDSGQSARPDKVTMALDKPHYRAGDVAKLTLVPPSAGEAIVVVEANKALWSQRIHLPKEGAELEIPIDAAWNRHDMYISVVHIQPANNLHKITPTRAFGLIHLPLNREDKKLNIDFDAPEKWLPNQTVNVQVSVYRGDKEQPVPLTKAWLTLAAVDVGILNITDYETPSPQDFFFAARRYQVDSLDIYNRLIELNNNELARTKFGGDAGDISRGGKQAKSEVQIVSLFSGLVDVINGKANVKLDLPDFNGRIKLMAVAFTSDSVGSAEQEVTVAAPLVSQLSMPRFVAHGDKSTLALDLNNLSGMAQALKVKISSTGPVQLNENEMTLQLADKTLKTLLYPFEVSEGGEQSQIKLTVTGMDDYVIDREWTLNARSAYPAITRSIAAVLKKDESMQLPAAQLDDYITSSLEASLSIANSVDLGVRNQMDRLLRYPYGCLEQSTSSTYPWAFSTPEMLDKMELKNTTGKTQAQSIEHGLIRITSKQKKNGSFGLWSNTDKDEQHWLTAYVGDFITDGRQQGFKVSDELYDKTMKRLGEYLRNSSSYSVRWSEYPGHYKFAYRAYSAYVLSRHNKAQLGHLRNLVQRKSDAKSFLPLIHLALALRNQGDNQAADKLLDEALNSLKRHNGYLADYGSEVRDLAMAIHLLTRHNVREKDVLNISLKLAKTLKGRTYLSTQERNSLFLAGIALESGSFDKWQADLQYANAIENIKMSGSKYKFLSGEQMAEGLKLTNTSDNLIFTTLNYSGFAKTAPQAVSNKGLSIERDYYTIQGKKITPDTLNVGEMVLVSLHVVADKRMPDLMVVDLLPAGLELENQNLKHASKLADIIVEGETVSQLMKHTKIEHQEFRDDRYVAAINLGWQKEAHVFYLARAVTPGTYKVPAPYAEDMYDPEKHAIGITIPVMNVVQ